MMTRQGGRDRASVASSDRDAKLDDPDVKPAFLTAFRHHPAGVAVITGDPGGSPVALTISSLISISIEPPMVAFSLSEGSSSAGTLMQCDTVVVHFARRKDMQLARLCATSGAARFGAGVAWARLPTGEPYYPQVAVWFKARVHSRISSPGAWLVTAELLRASPFLRAPPDDETLVYADRTWHGLRPLIDPVRTPLAMWPDDSPTF
jgi:flavin reductase (DIM6/NTAB) family NADH-FMN oxidoreductase RutF